MIALASIKNLLVHKGLLSIENIDTALQKAQAFIRGDERTCEDMSPANRDAIRFPIRLLQIANSAQGEADIPSFFGTGENGGTSERALQRSDMIAPL